MISKKKLTAIAVAGLFVTPVMADTVVSGSQIYSGDNSVVADDEKFAEAVKNSQADYVKLFIVNSHGSENNGEVKLTLKKAEGYKLQTVAFHENAPWNNANHKLSLSLEKSGLDLENGIIFRNAAQQITKKFNGDVVNDPKDNLQTTATVTLNQSTLRGDIINQYNGYNEGTTNEDKTETYYYQASLKTTTKVDLTDSTWVGDLRDENRITEKSTSLTKPLNKDDVKSDFIVNLENSSSWTGGVDVAKKSTVEVTLDATSSWTVNKDSKVNSIQFENVATRKAAEKNGVAIADGVTLTVADGLKDKTSTINALHTGAGSTLAVEKANVTLHNFAGKGDIVLNKDGKVTVNAADNKVNATFTSLEGSKFTTDKNVDANVTIAGALVDEKGMDAVIKQFNDNKNYEGKGLITFSGGMVADDVFGINDKGQFVQTGTTKNAQLVSIGESTAITMMQWRADADDMYQRMGDLRNNNGSVGVWARTFGGKAEAGHVDNKYYGVQAGVDTQVATTGPKQFVGGAMSYTTGDATFANGTGDNYMGTFTGYSTWLFDNGSYVDVAAKVGKLNNEFDLAVEGKKLAGKYSTQAVALTVESGHRFPVTNLTYVEPQVAFTASHIFGEDYGATNGVTIEQDSINSYVARVGVQAGLNCPDNMGSVFVRASYLYDFDGETSTVARNAKETNRFDQDFGGGWYELGLGMNVNFTKNLYGYADFEYVTGGEIKTPYRWNAGVRYAF